MILGRIKDYALIALGGLVVVLAWLAKHLLGERARLTRELETKDAKIKRAKVIADQDNEALADRESRRVDAKRELEETGNIAAARNPNLLRRKKGSDS